MLNDLDETGLPSNWHGDVPTSCPSFAPHSVELSSSSCSYLLVFDLVYNTSVICWVGLQKIIFYREQLYFIENNYILSRTIPQDLTSPTCQCPNPTHRTGTTHFKFSIKTTT